MPKCAISVAVVVGTGFGSVCICERDDGERERERERERGNRLGPQTLLPPPLPPSIALDFDGSEWRERGCH